MTLEMLDKVLWAATLIFIAGIFFVTACRLMRLTAAENHARGMQDAKPLRARNGQFIGRGE